MIQFILVFTVLSGAFAQSIQENNPGTSNGEIVQDTVTDLIGEMIPGRHSGNQFIACSDQEVELYQNALEHVKQRNEEVLQEIESLTPEYLQSLRSVKAATHMVKCVLRKAPNIKIHCSNNPSFQGLAFWGLSSRIYMNTESNWTSMRNVYGHNTGFEKYLGGTVTHEIAHKCGAVDAQYFDGAESPSSSGLVNWSLIADSYARFFMHGYCVPGSTCP